MVLNDVTEFVRNGASIKQEKGCKGTPITRIETISNSRFNYDRLGYADIFDDKYQDYYLQDNDVLLSHINSEKYLGRSVVYKQRTDENIIHGMNLLCLRFLKNRYNPSYFCYYSQSDIARMYISRNTKKSVNQASITATAIKNMPIPTTSIEEQKNVVYRLDSVQSIIDLYNEQMKKLDELIKSRFIEMFGHIGLDEKGWGLSRLGKCCELNPKRPKTIDDGMVISFIPMPSVSDDGQIDAGDLRLYSKVKKGYTYFEENDVLFAKITPCMENGKGCIAKGLKNLIGSGSTEFHVLRPISGVSNPQWLYAVTMQKPFRELAQRVMTGTGGQLRVPVDFLEYFPISLPPIKLQDQFADFVTQVEKQKATVQQSIDKLETLKKSLMQEYFG